MFTKVSTSEDVIERKVDWKAIGAVAGMIFSAVLLGLFIRGEIGNTQLMNESQQNRETERTLREKYDYATENAQARLENHETKIVGQGLIIERINTELENLSEDVAEIKTDVKALLNGR